MKATLWLWSLATTLLCVSHHISAAQFSDSRLIQDNYLSPKRTKPSLSIVNPLDVLRQRIILEMARRQMRENTKQVEINKAILKNIGKRGNDFVYKGNSDLPLPFDYMFYNKKLYNQHLRYPDKLSMGAYYPDSEGNEDDYISAGMEKSKQQQQQPPADQRQQSKEPNNKQSKEPMDDKKLLLDTNNLYLNDEALNESNKNNAEEDADDDFRLKYIYSLHKNRYAN